MVILIHSLPPILYSIWIIIASIKFIIFRKNLFETLDIIKRLLYNIVTVKGESHKGKGVALMKFREWKQLTREQKQKAFDEYKKRVVTCSSK